jgi:hypothetical protein
MKIQSILMAAFWFASASAHADLTSAISGPGAKVACVGYGRELVISELQGRSDYQAVVTGSGFTFYPSLQHSVRGGVSYVDTAYTGDGFQLLLHKVGDEVNHQGYRYQDSAGRLTFRQKDLSLLTIEVKCLGKYLPSGGGIG